MGLNPGRKAAPRRDWTGTLRQRDLDFGDHPFRFIEGGDTVDTVMWPTEAFDDEAGEMQQTWRSIRLPLEDKHTVFDRLAAKEKAIRQAVAAQEGIKPESTMFDRRRSNLFAVFNVGDPSHKNKPDPILFAITSWGVATEIDKFHNTGSKANPQYLEWGPMQFYNIFVCKYLQDGKPGDRRSDAQRTRYRAEVRRNDWAERCPMEWREGVAEDFDFVAEGVFTQAEWDAIASCDVDILSEAAPHSEEEQIAMLKEFPINFNYVKRDDELLFEDNVRGQLQEVTTQLGVPLIGQGTGVNVPYEPDRAASEEPGTGAIDAQAEDASTEEVVMAEDTVWCDEDGEDTHYTVVGFENGSTTLKDEEGNVYDVPTNTVHLVVATASEEEALPPEMGVGVTVWCDEDGEDTFFTVTQVNGEAIEVKDEEGNLYDVASAECHVVAEATVAEQKAADWGGDDDEEKLPF